ncbi:MAG: heme-binding protein [Ktedonobacteraceae bacterium]|nr:heme-binding protein [Ktedonobacteraceae bacterium]
MSISIELAQRVLGACKQRAHELRAPVSIAIVDSGGHLVLFERMMAPYGWATGDMSIAKAHTSVMFNQPTDAIAQWGAAIPGFASSLAAMTHGKFVMAAGGWPLRVNGITIGGIGVSGGNAPGRDDDIARAGVAIIDALSPATQQVVAQQAVPQPVSLYSSPEGETNGGEASQPTRNEMSPSFYSAQEPPTTHHLPANEDDPYRAFRPDSANPNRPGERK